MIHVSGKRSGFEWDKIPQQDMRFMRWLKHFKTSERVKAYQSIFASCLQVYRNILKHLKTSPHCSLDPPLADNVQCHGAKPLFHVDGFASNQHGFPEFMLLINYTVTDVWHAASFQQFSCGLHMERTSLLLGACFFFVWFSPTRQHNGARNGSNPAVFFRFGCPKNPILVGFFVLPCLRLRPPSRYLPIAPRHGQTPKPGRQQQKNRWKRGGSIIFEIRFLGNLQEIHENQATFCEMPLKWAHSSSKKTFTTVKFFHSSGPGNSATSDGSQALASTSKDGSKTCLFREVYGKSRQRFGKYMPHCKMCLRYSTPICT